MPGNDTARARVIAGRYRVLDELGRGGMGVVWLAGDELAGRRVAVKELRPPRGLGDDDRGVFQRRALQEARSSARIHHPGAVTLFDVLPATAADEAVYLIMELIDGPSLAAVIARDGRLPDKAAASLGRQLLDVLQAAHGLGIVHRDVKPGNILLAAGQQVKLTDFGIAHTTGATRLTRGGIMGTRAYMAPELFERNAAITPAADLWSLGATLYCAVSGQGPFDRDTTEATLRAILLDDVPVPRCEPGLAAAITGLLQRDPARRAGIDQARGLLLKPAGPATGPATGPGPGSHPRTGGETSGPEKLGSEKTGQENKLHEPTTTISKPGPDVSVAPPGQVTTFTNSPGNTALALWRTAWILGLGGTEVGTFVIGYYLGWRAFIASAVVFYLLIIPLGFTSIGRSLGRWRTLVLDSRGFAVDKVTFTRSKNRVASVRWDQVVRVGTSGQPAKRFLCACVSGGAGKPAKSVSLCPVGSQHFPVSEILAAIRSYRPTITIEPGGS